MLTEKAFEMLLNFIDAASIMIFLTLYLGAKYSGWKKYGGLVLGIAVDIAVTMILNHIYIFEALFSLIFILLYFTYMILFLKGDIYKKIFLAGFMYCIIYAVGAVCLLSTGILIGKTYEELLVFSTVRVIYCFSTKAVLILVLAVILRFPIKSTMPKSNAIAFILVPLVAELSIVEIVNMFIMHEDLKAKLFVVLGSVVGIIILSYYMLIRIESDLKLQKANAALKQKVESDREHAKEIVEMYDEICGIRHDLTIYFSNALTYMQESPEKAAGYMQSIVKEHLDIKNAYIDTGNKCFDTIVSAKIAICNRLDIYVSMEVMNGSLERLNDDEIGIIFGNLFDNAIEASKKSQERTIELEVKIKGDILSILMQNSVDKSVLESNKSLATTKKDKERHGYGTKNIKRIVADREGTIKYFEENGYFGCHITI